MLQNQCNSGGRFFSSLFKVEVVSKVERASAQLSSGNLLELPQIHRHGFTGPVGEEDWQQNPCSPSESLW